MTPVDPELGWSLETLCRILCGVSKGLSSYSVDLINRRLGGQCRRKDRTGRTTFSRVGRFEGVRLRTHKLRCPSAHPVVFTDDVSRPVLFGGPPRLYRGPF